MWSDPTQLWDTADAEYQEAVTVLWEKAELRYKLDESQQRVYDHFSRAIAGVEESAEREYVLDVSRRWGKSTIMCLIAVETALDAPDGRIPYGAPTRDMVRELLVPIMHWVMRDCPPHLRPTFYETRKEWVFRNGARIKMVGCNQDPDSLRGTSSAAAFLDEAGFIRRLDYIAEEVLRPQLLTEPSSFLLMGSTPPETPGHPWSAKYVPEAKSKGLYVHRTIEDNPRITDGARRAFIEKAGGRTSTRCRRELFAEHVIEESLAIIPEFQHVKDEVVCELPRPTCFHAYAALDPGWTHLCAGLFGYLDFLEQRVVIENDFAMRHAHTRDVAEKIKEIEVGLWGGMVQPGTMKPQPYMRYSDTDMRLIADLQKEYSLLFSPTAKDDRDHAIAQVRVWMQQKKIWIHPRCTTLIAHLDHGIWNTSRKQFAENPYHGHFDAIAALVYLMRNIQWRKNPYPTLPEHIQAHTHFVGPNAHRQDDQFNIAKMFKRRRGGRR